MHHLVKWLGDDMEESERYLCLTKFRLMWNFGCPTERLFCIMARLLSISILCMFYNKILGTFLLPI